MDIIEPLVRKKDTIQCSVENKDINKKLFDINLNLDNFKIKMDELLLHIIETKFKELFIFKTKNSGNPFIKLNELYKYFIIIIKKYSNINPINRIIKLNLKIKDYVSNFTILISAYFTFNKIINECIIKHGNDINEIFFLNYVKNYIETIYAADSIISREQLNFYNSNIKKINDNNIFYHFIIYNYNLFFNKNSIKKEIRYVLTGNIFNFELNSLTFNINLLDLPDSDAKYNIKNIVFLILYYVNKTYSHNINCNDYITIPQYDEICWFISMINAMCYSDLSKKILLSKKDAIKIKYGMDDDSYDINNIIKKKSNYQENIKDFIYFIYYIIENVTNEFKTYNDYLNGDDENKKKLNTLLNLFKYFPLKFLSSMAKIEKSNKRKSASNLDIREIIKNNNQQLLELELSLKLKLELKKSELKLKSKSKSRSGSGSGSRSESRFDNSINKLKSDIKALKNTNNALNKELLQMLINGIYDENYYWLYSNFKDKKYGANLFSYNILVQFYEYFDMKVLFLYLDTKTNKLYIPTNTPTLNNIHDYDIIIISKFNVNYDIGLPIDEANKQKLIKEIFIDIEANQIFLDIESFTENFTITDSKRIIKSDFSINDNNFELDYTLHGTEISKTCANCGGHCISNITYNKKLYAYNSMYNILNTDISSHINKGVIIPCNLIENDWKEHINSNNCYNIKRCYYEDNNDKLIELLRYADPYLYTFCYENKIRYVYIKNNNIEQIEGGNKIQK